MDFLKRRNFLKAIAFTSIIAPSAIATKATEKLVKEYTSNWFDKEFVRIPHVTIAATAEPIDKVLYITIGQPLQTGILNNALLRNTRTGEVIRPKFYAYNGLYEVTRGFGTIPLYMLPGDVLVLLGYAYEEKTCIL